MPESNLIILATEFCTLKMVMIISFYILLFNIKRGVNRAQSYALTLLQILGCKLVWKKNLETLRLSGSQPLFTMTAKLGSQSSLCKLQPKCWTPNEISLDAWLLQAAYKLHIKCYWVVGKVGSGWIGIKAKSDFLLSFSGAI